jgi:hypothetical protein
MRNREHVVELVSMVRAAAGLSLLVRLLAACSLCALPLRLEGAAIQVEGTLTYEVFSRGMRRLLVEEQFAGVFESNKWRVDTRLLSTQPVLTRPQLFCPEKQSAGSDGEDVYYLKELGAGAAQGRVAQVEPGPVPKMVRSPSVCLLWMAYCSGYYLAGTGRQKLPPVWGTDESRNRRGECLVGVTWRPSERSPGYLEQLDFLSDGRMNPCRPSRDLTNLCPKPWAAGFTQALFRVEQVTAVSGGVQVPAQFTFQLFAPAPAASPPRLDVLSAMHGALTAAIGGVQMEDWLPRLPKDQPVIVEDYRFTRDVTNWDAVAYAVTNGWSARKGAVAVAAVQVHALVSPMALRTVARKGSVRLVRGLLLAALLLPLIAALGWRLVRSRKATRKET